MKIKGYAEIDITKKYRYLLGRKWDENLPQVTFIMLNPSKADENEGDPTLTRCIKFAQSWKKYGSLELVNLFAYRATYPTELGEVDDPVGPDNDHYIKLATQRADLIVLAWGNGANKHTRIKNRDQEVLSLISGRQPLYCLKLTKKGNPHHPRGLRNDLEPIIFTYQQS